MSLFELLRCVEGGTRCHAHHSGTGDYRPRTFGLYGTLTKQLGGGIDGDEHQSFRGAGEWEPVPEEPEN